MDKLTNALMLKDEAPRSHVAMIYGVAGIAIGMFVLGNK